MNNALATVNSDPAAGSSINCFQPRAIDTGRLARIDADLATGIDELSDQIIELVDTGDTFLTASPLGRGLGAACVAGSIIGACFVADGAVRSKHAKRTSSPTSLRDLGAVCWSRRPMRFVPFLTPPPSLRWPIWAGSADYGIEEKQDGGTGEQRGTDRDGPSADHLVQARRMTLAHQLGPTSDDGTDNPSDQQDQGHGGHSRWRAIHRQRQETDEHVEDRQHHSGRY